MSSLECILKALAVEKVSSFPRVQICFCFLLPEIVFSISFCEVNFVFPNSNRMNVLEKIV